MDMFLWSYLEENGMHSHFGDNWRSHIIFIVKRLIGICESNLRDQIEKRYLCLDLNIDFSILNFKIFR